MRLKAYFERQIWVAFCNCAVTLLKVLLLLLLVKDAKTPDFYREAPQGISRQHPDELRMVTSKVLHKKQMLKRMSSFHFNALQTTSFGSPWVYFQAEQITHLTALISTAFRCLILTGRVLYYSSARPNLFSDYY